MSRPNQKKDKRRKHRMNRRSGPSRKRSAHGENPEPNFDLRVPRPDLTHPPIHIDGAGAVMPNPYTLLGIDPGASIEADVVQAAFRAALAETSPESDPERARNLVEARNWLLDPKLAISRALGDLRAPRTECFLPNHAQESDAAGEAESESDVDWTSRARLIAVASLFALLEAEIEEGGTGDGPAEGLLGDGD